MRTPLLLLVAGVVTVSGCSGSPDAVAKMALALPGYKIG